MENSDLIVALDFDTDQAALACVDQLDPSMCHLKVATTLFTRYGPSLVEQLQRRGFNVFLDLKFHDIPMQVAGACRSAAALGVWMLTIHTLGGERMCAAAASALSHCRVKPILVGVTILTSTAATELEQLGVSSSLPESVDRLAHIAHQSGLDGVVCSPWELHQMTPFGPDWVTVTPGIRMQPIADDDQRRVMTPQAARAAGAQYLVMGRTITQASDPLAALRAARFL